MLKRVERNQTDNQIKHKSKISWRKTKTHPKWCQHTQHAKNSLATITPPKLIFRCLLQYISKDYNYGFKGIRTCTLIVLVQIFLNFRGHFNLRLFFNTFNVDIVTVCTRCVIIDDILTLPYKCIDYLLNTSVLHINILINLVYRSIIWPTYQYSR